MTDPRIDRLVEHYRIIYAKLGKEIEVRDLLLRECLDYILMSPAQRDSFAVGDLKERILSAVSHEDD